MSLSILQSQKYLVEIEALSQLLKRFVESRNKAVTQEAQLLIEHEAVVFLQRVLDLDYELRQVSTGEYLSAQELFSTYSDYETLLSFAFLKLRKFVDLFLNHYNINQNQLLALSGKVRRIKQKQSTLRMWNSSDAKYLLVESFLNLDNLANSFSDAESCTVHSGSGMLTLPVRSKRLIKPKKISISQGSNGVPGNSDIETTVNNTSIESVLKSDPNQWFEYERLDQGPLQLNITIELAKEDIVNFIRLVPINLGQSLTGVVSDIVFSRNGQSSVSIKQLINKTVERDSWQIKTVSPEGWSLPFLPIRTKTITIKITQTEPYQVLVSNDTSKRYRRRYAVGLRSLEIAKLTYSDKGTINSTVLEIPSELYVGTPTLSVTPAQIDLYNSELDVSLDAGETWTPAHGEFLLNGNEELFAWRLALTRNNSVVRQQGAFSESATTQEATSLLRTVSATNSPYTLTLPTKPQQNRICVMQSKIGSRGSKHKRVFIGFGTGTATSMALPFGITGRIHPESLHVFVNGREYDYQPNNQDIDSQEWSLSDDFSEIEFSSDLGLNSKVELSLDPEIMEFEQRADGYYHNMEMLFDPDKNSIEIEALPKQPVKTTLIVPRDTKVFAFGYNNLVSDSLSWTSKNDVSYTEVSTRALAVTTANSFYIDYSNGVMWLNAPTDEDTVRISFDHMTGIRLDSKDFDITYDDNTAVPLGVRIDLDKFTSLTHTDTVGESQAKIIDIRSGAYSERDSHLTSNNYTKVLSYDHIVKNSLVVSSNLFGEDYQPEEIEFIDGHSEFYGLTEIEDEQTTAIASGGSTVNFKLSAGALWYPDLGVHFSNSTVFATLVASESAVNATGKYYIAPDGTVTVHGSSLASGIAISYYYKNPNFDGSNKFSVDYRSGILYSTTELESGSSITYKVASYKVSYNVSRLLTDYSYSSELNSVAISTERLHPINNLVRVAWLKENVVNKDIDMTEYFSPIVSMLGFRFT